MMSSPHVGQGLQKSRVEVDPNASTRVLVIVDDMEFSPNILGEPDCGSISRPDIPSGVYSVFWLPRNVAYPSVLFCFLHLPTEYCAALYTLEGAIELLLYEFF